MRYIGRHRASRPIYLRRPVIGGVAAALVVGGPALALTNPTGGPSAASRTPPSSTSARTPDTLVPTDAPLPPDTASSSTRRTLPQVAITTRPQVAGTTRTTTSGRSSTTASTTKPRTSTTKPTATTPTSTTVALTVTVSVTSPVASAGVVTGAVTVSGRRGTLSYAATPSWVSVSTGGVLSGTAPTTAGTYTVTVDVTDTHGDRGSGSADLTVTPAAAG